MKSHGFSFSRWSLNLLNVKRYMREISQEEVNCAVVFRSLLSFGTLTELVKCPLPEEVLADAVLRRLAPQEQIRSTVSSAQVSCYNATPSHLLSSYLLISWTHLSPCRLWMKFTTLAHTRCSINIYWVNKKLFLLEYNIIFLLYLFFPSNWNTVWLPTQRYGSSHYWFGFKIPINGDSQWPCLYLGLRLP